MPQRSPTVSIVVNGSPVVLNPNDVNSDFGHSNRRVVRVSLNLPPLKPDQDERSSSGASSGLGSDDETPFDCDFSSVNYNMRSLDSAIDMKDLQRDLNACLAGKDGQSKDGCRNDVCFSAVEGGTHEYDSDMKFHMKELDSVVNGVSDSAREDEHPLDAALAKEQAIISRQGTVRGVKNIVRASIKCIAESQDGRRNYCKEEVGRIVLYTTSMGVIRHTWEQCRRVKNILQTLLVRFEERDVFMNRTFQKEIMERTGMPYVVVPHMFVEGHHLGGAELVERLNETGELRQMLKAYKKTSVGGTCPMCGGYQYLPCPVCGGSKKSIEHRHRFSSSIIYLRCLNCDEGGLVRCQMCLHGDG